MYPIRLILLVVAFVCFLLHAYNIGPPRFNLLGLGLACWVLTEIIPGGK